MFPLFVAQENVMGASKARYSSAAGREHESDGCCAEAPEQASARKIAVQTDIATLPNFSEAFAKAKYCLLPIWKSRLINHFASGLVKTNLRPDYGNQSRNSMVL